MAKLPHAVQQVVAHMYVCLIFIPHEWQIDVVARRKRHKREGFGSRLLLLTAHPHGTRACCLLVHLPQFAPQATCTPASRPLHFS